MKLPPFPDREQRARVRAECTGQSLRRATRTVTRIYDETLAPSGLRGTQFSLLIALSFFKEAPLLRVAEELSLDRTTLTRNAGPLRRKGLIRVGAGPDGRSSSVALTARGHAVLGRAYPLWRKTQRRIIARLGRRRWESLIGDLSELRDAARA